MNRSFHQRISGEIPQRLAELLELPHSKVRVRPVQRLRSRTEETNYVIDAGPHRFLIEYKAQSTAAPVAAAVRLLRTNADRKGKKAIPLVVTPFMGEVGRQLCAEADVSWMDLSGNARIEVPGLRIHIQGKPNLFKRSGRPASLFAPKSSRIVHWLLMHPNQPFAQRELAHAVGLGEGFVSRIVRGLVEQELVVRESGGSIRIGNYEMLLKAWREAYDFSKHTIIRGHMAARSSDEILHRLAERLDNGKLQHAVTGLAGAWLCTHFAGFRLVSIYISEPLGTSELQELGFQNEQRGENVWLVIPNDVGVFLGANRRDGLMCVDPVQLYLDLQNHPERAPEAAEHLRQQVLMRKPHA